MAGRSRTRSRAACVVGLKPDPQSYSPPTQSYTRPTAGNFPRTPASWCDLSPGQRRGISTMTRFNLSIAILACSVATSSIAAPDNVRYRLTQIVPETPTSTVAAADLNDRGQVVGSIQEVSGREHAFAWRAGTLTNLGPMLDPTSPRSRAIANNDRGDILGFFFDAQRRHVRELPAAAGPGDAHRRLARRTDRRCRHQRSSADHRQLVLRGRQLAGLRLGGRQRHAAAAAPRRCDRRCLRAQ